MTLDLSTWRPTAHDERAPEGERCWCGVCAPPPSVSEYEAASSTTARGERDVQLAAWLRLAPDQVEPFLRRLSLIDVWTEIAEEEDAITALHAARAKRAEVESRGDLTRLRGQGVQRLSRRLPRPSPSRDAA